MYLHYFFMAGSSLTYHCPGGLLYYNTLPPTLFPKTAMPTIRETTFNTKFAEILRRKNLQWREGNTAVAEAGEALRGGGNPEMHPGAPVGDHRAGVFEV